MKGKSATSWRLDRLLNQVAGLGRAAAQRAIRAGEVRVDGKPATDPARRVPGGARIEYRGQVVAMPAPRYFMLHKPAGVVCATRDREHRTVLDLLEVPNKAGLHVAGRLDIGATGLVLISDDGEWSHRLTSPRHKVSKTYRVTLASRLDDAAVAALRGGIRLRNEPKCCAPAAVEPLPGNEARLTVTEGKYHQVKRMLAAVGNHVKALHRERIGGIALDPALAVGRYRPLTREEIAATGLPDQPATSGAEP
jgi:16S rRNA pseudouridine516 synthase